MKAIMITAPASNTGKTTLTLGIIRALKNRGLDVSSFKTGPDFIDSKYGGLASGKLPGNLDLHMMGEKGLWQSLALNTGDFAVIEGAMGYFDGISNTFINSSYHMSKILDLKTILVYSPKGEMFSAIPKIKGMAEFADSKIEGIILNKVSKTMYEMLKEQIEKYTDLEVLGYVPKLKELEIESLNLGLKIEDREADETIDRISEIIEKSLEIDRIIDFASDLEIGKFNYPKRQDLKISIAKDQVFEFNYSENIKLLEAIGQISYFSPLEDKAIGDSDLVIIGTGYIEDYKEELAKNESMKKSLRDYVEAGGYLIAEGQGLIYLTEAMEEYSFLGILRGESYMTNKLSRFGYVNIETREETAYGPRGRKLYANEYHKSEVRLDEDEIFNISKPKSKRTWQCGYRYKNALGYFQHINYLGNKEAFETMIKNIGGK